MRSDFLLPSERVSPSEMPKSRLCAHVGGGGERAHSDRRDVHTRSQSDATSSFLVKIRNILLRREKSEIKLLCNVIGNFLVCLPPSSFLNKKK